MDEQMRIRALVVARMNLFRGYMQKEADRNNEESMHAWALAFNAMKGLLDEIDSGQKAHEQQKH